MGDFLAGIKKKYGRGSYSPVPSNSPYCPKAAAFAESHPERLRDTELMDMLAMEMGTAAHEVLQDAISEQYELFGDWECQTCGKQWFRCLKPAHEHFTTKYKEPKFALPGVGRNCKSDAILQLSEGVFTLLEFKFPGFTPKQPNRKHYLQANLTAYVASQVTGINIPDFAVMYFCRSDLKQESVYRYLVDKEVAEIQLELMQKEVSPEIGICRNPGDWYCPWSDLCFADGKQGKWIQDNPEWAIKLKKLEWEEQQI